VYCVGLMCDWVCRMYTIFIDVHFLTFNYLQFLRIKLIY